MKNQLLALSLSFLVVCSSTLAQQDASWTEEKTTQVNDLLDKMHEQKQFNGAVLLAEDGEIVYERYLGVENDPGEDKISVDSSFRLASVSKQFTGMAIMILKEQGKLEYDDDIQKFLPGLDYEGVTVRHLLHHTAGLPDYEQWFGTNWDTDKDFDDRKTAFNKDVFEQFVEHKPERKFAPGERWEYSNTGYVLLGHIIEKASGMPTRDFMQKHIFTPLEMSNSQAFSPSEEFNVKHRVYGLSRIADGSFEANDWNYLNGMIGDGGVYASARDLLKWDQALYAEKLVADDTLAEAFTPGELNDGSKTDYGFGWSIQEEEGKPVIVEHSGGWVGFRTFIRRDLKTNRTLILLTNDSSAYFGRVLSSLGDVVSGEEIKAPKMSIATKLAEIIENDGPAAASKAYYELRKTERRRFDFGERGLTDLADLYRDRGEFENAVAIYKLSVDRNKNSANAQRGLGLCMIELGKQHLQESLKLFPGNAEATEVLRQLGEDVAEVPDLSEEDLEEYVGEYQFTPEISITISRAAKVVSCQVTGQPEIEMQMVGKDRFTVDIVDAQFTFNRDDDGKIESVSINQGGGIQTATRQ